MNIEKVCNGNEIVLKVTGRLDTTTAPQLEREVKLNIVGVKNAKKLLEDIPNKIVTTLGIVAEVNLLKENTLDYIEIIVPPSSSHCACRSGYSSDKIYIVQIGKSSPVHCISSVANTA